MVRVFGLHAPLLCCEPVTVCVHCVQVCWARDPERTWTWALGPIQETDGQHTAVRRHALFAASRPLAWALAHSWSLISVRWNGMKEKPADQTGMAYSPGAALHYLEKNCRTEGQGHLSVLWTFIRTKWLMSLVGCCLPASCWWPELL